MEQLYFIHHATGKERFLEVENQPRVYVDCVWANSLEQAYIFAQNMVDSWSPNMYPCRSTAVGDMIQTSEGEFFMVCGEGFRPLSFINKIQNH